MAVTHDAADADSTAAAALHFNGHFSKWTWVSRYVIVSILDFAGSKDDGGGEWWQLEL